MLNPKYKFRAVLAELWSRVIRRVDSNDYYTNGDDDNYSRSVERVIMNSPTASRASSAMAKYIAGAGLTNDFVLYDDISLSDVVKGISQDLANQGGCFVHRSIKYDIEADKFVTDKIEVLDYHGMRIGIEDDNENDGKFWEFDANDKKGFKQAKKKFYYPFSNSQRAIKAQIEADSKDTNAQTIAEKLQHYRGQVMYLNTTPRFVYAVSPFDSAYNDMDTEYRIGLYSNKVFRSGFLGKKMILFKEIQQVVGDENSEFEDENEKMRALISEWMGAENSDSVFVTQVDNMTEIDDFMKVIDVPTNYDEDMYTNTVERVRRNILGCAGNLPEALLFTNDGGLFSGSGEQLIQLKKFYSEQTKEYRAMIEKALKRLGFDTKIIELSDGVVTAE